jgi:hypothetical protein
MPQRRWVEDGLVGEVTKIGHPTGSEEVTDLRPERRRGKWTEIGGGAHYGKSARHAALASLNFA